MNFFEKLKLRWQITSNWQVAVILIVFSITGSASMIVTAPLFKFFGLSKEAMSGWVYWPLRILITFLAYQVLLIIIGTLLGQHKFFWGMEKKMLKRFGLDLDKDTANK